jgi:hypothetical protein
MEAVEKYQLDVYGYRPLWGILGIGVQVCPEAWSRNPQNTNERVFNSQWYTKIVSSFRT